ncbi:efflux transporter outer membrane subunit [Novosphingobium sp. FSY-8]|uniref:Efflux transporter outer membrane subunit n=1 Tax=Novosphingobium ovatum TaxID=1908523 RepID=A0ABW9XHU2_9SPHN|nr:efflux transporter outer membrane subunit [Novosphingobium ovatum]NBC38129.1 efflux transporter outer membrane subunit [Novosphingobium ovatum]
MTPAHSRLLISLLAGGLPLALGACAVGPRYAGPPAPPVASDARFARGAGLAAGQPALANWWEALGDARLNTLMAQALANSPSVAEAQARLAEAGALLRQRKASDLPSVSPTLITGRAELPAFTPGGSRTDLEIYNLGATASWEPDFWGMKAADNASAAATRDKARAQLADVQVSLSAQVAQAYVNLRDAQGRLAQARALTGLRARALELIEQRFKAGAATQADIARAQTARAQAAAAQAPLQAQAEVALNQLAVLTGHAPGALDGDLAALAPLPQLPASVAVGDPAGLIARRPDIRTAERQLAASTANIAATRAKLLPRLSFTGILGMGSNSVESIVDPSTAAYGVLPQLKWSGLDWGKGRASVAQARAQKDTAQAQYTRAVLTALEDAESSLSRFRANRTRLAELDVAAAAARRAADLGAQRVAAGTLSGLEQADIAATAQQAQMTAAQARADLLSSYITVAKALGLGWRD